MEDTLTAQADIISVQTKKDFYKGFDFIPAGTPGTKHFQNWQWKIDDELILNYHESYIRLRPKRFKIETETKNTNKFILALPKDINLWEESFINSELNKLAEFCNQQYEKENEMFYVIYFNDNFKKLMINSYKFSYYQGLKFTSEKSAKLFIEEISKFADYYTYFVAMLKNTRL